MDTNNQLKGYERRVFLKEDICERFGIQKNVSFELGYILFGNIAVLYPKDFTLLEIKETLDRLKDRIKEKLNSEKIYKSI